MRQSGFSLNEISKESRIAKSTASLWLSNVKLSPTASRRIKDKQTLGRQKAIISRKKMNKDWEEKLKKNTMKMVKKIKFSKEIAKLCCSLIWWCEGNKNDSTVRFTNSDPTLIKDFLYLLRFGFLINESKFRALIHLHGYHNEKDQMKFWSEVTNIPLNQFYKSYQNILMHATFSIDLACSNCAYGNTASAIIGYINDNRKKNIPEIIFNFSSTRTKPPM